LGLTQHTSEEQELELEHAIALARRPGGLVITVGTGHAHQVRRRAAIAMLQ